MTPRARALYVEWSTKLRPLSLVKESVRFGQVSREDTHTTGSVTRRGLDEDGLVRSKQSIAATGASERVVWNRIQLVVEDNLKAA